MTNRNVNQKRKKRIIHKLILKSRPTKYQADAVEMFYLCNQAVRCDWRKTDLTPRRVNCKNCKKAMKNKIKEGFFVGEDA